MVNFKKDKNGKYHFTASLGFDKRTGKRVQKKRRGVKTVKEEKKRIPNLFLIMEKKQKLLKVLCCLRSFFINYSYLIIKGK
ncbi:Arm DNA-binding domain-containing protein [Enterococcus lactis]|uniref:Arm DNA-binding domain-containing protein n=1 Tax=Enterococcus faecium TaxID=1352 RepID=UPI00215355CE|nr:Arm DNA-binding domain-containing protein [Enterococcus faecium]MCO7397062.1 Arm DNA-binding domain-containing protein [Enterococcus lactis]